MNRWRKAGCRWRAPGEVQCDDERLFYQSDLTEQFNLGCPNGLVYIVYLEAIIVSFTVSNLPAA